MDNIHLKRRMAQLPIIQAIKNTVRAVAGIRLSIGMLIQKAEAYNMISKTHIFGLASNIDQKVVKSSPQPASLG